MQARTASRPRTRGIWRAGGTALDPGVATLRPVRGFRVLGKDAFELQPASVGEHLVAVRPQMLAADDWALRCPCSAVYEEEQVEAPYLGLTFDLHSVA
jgi:hypothetical protein